MDNIALANYKCTIFSDSNFSGSQDTITNNLIDFMSAEPIIAGFAEGTSLSNFSTVYYLYQTSAQRLKISKNSFSDILIEREALYGVFALTSIVAVSPTKFIAINRYNDVYFSDNGINFTLIYSSGFAVSVTSIPSLSYSAQINTLMIMFSNGRFAYINNASNATISTVPTLGTAITNAVAIAISYNEFYILDATIKLFKSTSIDSGYTLVNDYVASNSVVVNTNNVYSLVPFTNNDGSNKHVMVYIDEDTGSATTRKIRQFITYPLSELAQSGLNISDLSLNVTDINALNSNIFLTNESNLASLTNRYIPMIYRFAYRPEYAGILTINFRYYSYDGYNAYPDTTNEYLPALDEDINSYVYSENSLCYVQFDISRKYGKGLINLVTLDINNGILSIKTVATHDESGGYGINKIVHNNLFKSFSKVKVLNDLTISSVTYKNVFIAIAANAASSNLMYWSTDMVNWTSAAITITTTSPYGFMDFEVGGLLANGSYEIYIAAHSSGVSTVYKGTFTNNSATPLVTGTFASFDTTSTFFPSTYPMYCLQYENKNIFYLYQTTSTNNPVGIKVYNSLNEKRNILSTTTSYKQALTNFSGLGPKFVSYLNDKYYIFSHSTAAAVRVFDNNFNLIKTVTHDTTISPIFTYESANVGLFPTEGENPVLFRNNIIMAIPDNTNPLDNKRGAGHIIGSYDTYPKRKIDFTNRKVLTTGAQNRPRANFDIIFFDVKPYLEDETKRTLCMIIFNNLLFKFFYVTNPVDAVTYSGKPVGTVMYNNTDSNFYMVV